MAAIALTLVLISNNKVQISFRKTSIIVGIIMICMNSLLMIDGNIIALFNFIYWLVFCIYCFQSQ